MSNVFWEIYILTSPLKRGIVFTKLPVTISKIGEEF